MKRIHDSKICKYCGKLFHRKDLNLITGKKWTNRKYCSRKCLFKEGIPKDVRKKMGDSKRGVKKEPHTQEWKDNMAKILSGRIRGKYKPTSEQGLKNKRESGFKRRGENHSNWQGGKTNEGVRVRNLIEYKLWRKSVFERDNYTCIWCGDNKGGNLQADHIKPFSLFPELRFAIDNGRTLCESCHKTTDTWGSKVFTYKKNLR